jgi:hypothetical protein
MKTLITTLTPATFIAVPAFTQSTVAAPKPRAILVSRGKTTM